MQVGPGRWLNLGSVTETSERQPELPERRLWCRRGRSRTETEPSEQVASGLRGGRRLDPAHRSAAARTGIEVRGKHMTKQPRPTTRRQCYASSRPAAG